MNGLRESALGRTLTTPEMANPPRVRGHRRALDRTRSNGLLILEQPYHTRSARQSVRRDYSATLRRACWPRIRSQHMSDKYSRYFRCHPARLLSKLYGMSHAERSVYMTVLLIVNMDARPLSPADARIETLSRLCNLPKRKVDDAVAELLRFRHLARTDDGGLHLPDFDPALLGLSGNRVPMRQPLRKSVFERDGMICRYCGTEEGPFEIDHVIPVVRGGTDAPENLCVSCRPCNRAKGARIIGEALQ